MFRPGRNRLPSAAAWGAVALLAAAASARPARAECGDYVHLGTPAGVTTAGDGAPTPKPPVPCHGPHCSARQGPATPFAPATSPTGPAPADAILPNDPPPEPGHAGRVGSPPLHLPAGPVAAIFHPPRPA